MAECNKILLEYDGEDIDNFITILDNNKNINQEDLDDINIKNQKTESDDK
jgi:hypothetical protein